MFFLFDEIKNGSSASRVTCQENFPPEIGEWKFCVLLEGSTVESFVFCNRGQIHHQTAWTSMNSLESAALNLFFKGSEAQGTLLGFYWKELAWPILLLCVLKFGRKQP